MRKSYNKVEVSVTKGNLTQYIVNKKIAGTLHRQAPYFLALKCNSKEVTAEPKHKLTHYNVPTLT